MRVRSSPSRAAVGRGNMQRGRGLIGERDKCRVPESATEDQERKETHVRTQTGKGLLASCPVSLWEGGRRAARRTGAPRRGGAVRPISEELWHLEASLL